MDVGIGYAAEWEVDTVAADEAAVVVCEVDLRAELDAGGVSRGGRLGDGLAFGG